MMSTDQIYKSLKGNLREYYPNNYMSDASENSSLLRKAQDKNLLDHLQANISIEHELIQNAHSNEIVDIILRRAHS